MRDSYAEAGTESVDQDITKLSRAAGDEDLMKLIGTGIEKAEEDAHGECIFDGV